MENTVLILKRNEIIFNQGDKSDCMYDIRVGTVGIYANYGTKEEKLLTELTKDQFFGEMGIIEGYPRSATAVAMGDMTELTALMEQVEVLREAQLRNMNNTLLLTRLCACLRQAAGY